MDFKNQNTSHMFFFPPLMKNVFIFHMRNIHVLALYGLIILKNKVTIHYNKPQHVACKN